MGNEILNGFTLSIYDSMSSCVNTKLYTFHKGEYITLLQNNKNYFAIVKKGLVSLMRMVEDGNCYVIEKYGANDLFTKIWHKLDDSELFFVCNSEVEIVIIDYLQLLEGCCEVCPRHSMILNFFMQRILVYTSNLNQKLALLQIKKLEDRILTYFYQQCKGDKNSFTLKSNFKELADYFMVDRASFMRKLKELEDKGMIRRNGKVIEIINHEA